MAEIGCVLHLRETHGHGCFIVQLEHYEQLKDMLDRGDKGWVELKTIYADGKVMVRLEDISDMVYSTPAYAETMDDIHAKEKLA